MKKCIKKKKGARILIFESNKTHPASHFSAIDAKQEINFPRPYAKFQTGHSNIQGIQY